MNVPEIIIILSHVPILLTVVYAALLYRQLGADLRVFSWFLFLSGLIQFTSLYFWFHRWNNMPLLHLYVAAGFAFLAWFYQKVLSGFISVWIIGSVTALFTIFTIINSLYIQHVMTFDSNALTIESVLILILSLFTFTFLLNDSVKETRSHHISSLSWINSGLFIYYSSSLMIFYFGATITGSFSRVLGQYTWIFHSLFSMVMYTCFFIGLWKRPKT
jgi:hypothetical protein